MRDKVFKVIGLMSGTSLDGIDVALIETDGERVISTGASDSLAYSDEMQADLRAVMARAVSWGFNGPPPNLFSQVEAELDVAHIRAVREFAAKHDINLSDIDLIGYHGQTVLHRPATSVQKGATLQLGDGGRLARELGVDTAYDFRSADVAAGGQGAPLAPIYHKALLERDELTDCAVLNIGGVSNVTVITESGELLASDCGPGNGPLDSWIQNNTDQLYDINGRYSREGEPDFDRVWKWLKRPFYDLPVPRSADRYDFDVLSEMADMSISDGAATLCVFIADGVDKTLRDLGQCPRAIIICGGGRHNPIIRAALEETFFAEIVLCDDLEWDGDGLEAQAFAFLAARHVKGLPLSFPSTTGVKQAVTGGRLAKA